MKRIIIITDRERIAEKIREDLLCVFRGKAEIEKLTFEKIAGMPSVDGDLLLFTLGDRIERIKEKLLHPENIVIIRRTIREKNLVKLFEIPQGTPVLVVNDNYENTLQTVNLLYDLNVDNLILKPWDQTSCEDDVTIAVTPGEADRVPSFIKRIIDIGDRCVDLATFMDIIYRLQLGDEEISKRLLSYADGIVNSNRGLNQYYKETIMKNIQMKHVLESVDLGILLTLPDGTIVLCNQRFREMIKKPVREGVTRLSSLFDESLLEFFSRDSFDFEPARFGVCEMTVRKNRLSYDSSVYQELYFFRDITYVKSLEEKISRQVKKQGFHARYQIQDILYQSEAMNRCLESVRIFSPGSKTILLEGESGTGKELIAQSIHHLSERSHQPFVAVNCAAVPENLLESELFGYVRGAFTGASRDGKPGLFEQADKGTLFLDEIGDMPVGLQSRLLRVIQEKQIMRIGSDRVIDIDVRIIAATNRDLRQEMKCGRFRSDLYYRLSVLPVSIPPLRERKEDILLLFSSFLSEPCEIPERVHRILLAHDWPGNVRELRNAAEYFELMRCRENCLPDYLMHLEGSLLPEEEKQLLLLIRNAQDSGMPAGRSCLRQALSESLDTPVSEYHLRSLLDGLEQKGLAVKHTGRSGTRITEQGRRILR